MALSRTAILEDLFANAPELVSEDDCAENIVVPFFLRLGYARDQIRRKVAIRDPAGRSYKKQSDIVIYREGRPLLVVETKRLTHKLKEEDANQALAYAQLMEPSVPMAVLTNGRDWELYELESDEIGGLADVPDPTELEAIAKVAVRTRIVRDASREAASRMIYTIENKNLLEQAFVQCRQILAKEGLIAESAFDELTKVVVAKFNEERLVAEGSAHYRFTAAWLRGEGPVQGLGQLFLEAKRKFHVFEPGSSLRIRSNQTALDLVTALEPFGFYGFKTPLGLAGAGGDIVGSVYEAFLTGTLRGDLGQYLTPRQMIDFMVEIADIQIGERVLDLSCGSGGFLIRAFLDVRKKIRASQTSQSLKDDQVSELVDNHLWGIEINPRLATLCRINMILHGDGYEHIYTGNSIRDDVFENTDGRRVDLRRIDSGELPKFDVILMNPPFNLPYSDADTLNKFKLGRGRIEQGSDYLMLERAIRLLDDSGGRILIILPHGIASGVSEQDIRDYVTSNARLDACVSLPVGAFKPFGGSNARTCILVISKGSKRAHTRFLAQVEDIGYEVTTKYYREIEANQLPAVANAWHDRQRMML